MANLYNKAGLVNIPIGYSDGFLYNIKPTDNTLAFRFNRDSSATRVNKQGLIEEVSYFGPELVTNGDFATDSDWTLKPGSNISGGSLNFDGTQTSTRNINQSITSLDLTKIYKVTFTISNYTAGQVKVKISNNASGKNKTANGTYVQYLSGMTNTTLSITASNGFAGSIDNVSVVEVLGDKPRIDYTDSLTSPSFLLEPQSTNLALNSNDLTNNTWTKQSATTSSSTVVNPEGTSGASLYTCNNYTGSNQFFRINPNTTYDNDVSYSYSVFVKYNTFQFCKLSYMNFSIGEHFAAVFDIINGTVTSTNIGGTPQNTSSKIENFGNGWFRISISAAISSSSGNAMNFEFNKAPSGTPTFTLYGRTDQTTTTDDKVYVYGGQLEQLTYPTSYIPTGGSTATRVAETCNNAGSTSTFNDSEGVLYAEISALSNTSDSSKFISISDGTYNNRASILFSNGSTNQIRTFLRVGGVSQIDVSNNVTDVTDFNKVAFSYKENDFKVYINGSLVSTDTSGSVWTSGTITKLSLSEISTSAGLFNGNVKSVAVFKEALTDAELQKLTSWVSFTEMATDLEYTLE